jgi:hypothetical protein
MASSRSGRAKRQHIAAKLRTMKNTIFNFRRRDSRVTVVASLGKRSITYNPILPRAIVARRGKPSRKKEKYEQFDFKEYRG